MLVKFVSSSSAVLRRGDSAWRTELSTVYRGLCARNCVTRNYEINAVTSWFTCSVAGGGGLLLSESRITFFIFYFIHFIYFLLIYSCLSQPVTYNPITASIVVRLFVCFYDFGYIVKYHPSLSQNITWKSTDWVLYLTNFKNSMVDTQLEDKT